MESYFVPVKEEKINDFSTSQVEQELTNEFSTIEEKPTDILKVEIGSGLRLKNSSDENDYGDEILEITSELALEPEDTFEPVSNDDFKVTLEELKNIRDTLAENTISMPSSSSYQNNSEESTGRRTLNKRFSKVFLRREKNKNIYNFKCSNCTFESSYRHKLKRHLVTHQNREDLVTVTCHLCDYETVVKDDLRKHIFNHQFSKILDKFKCNFCDYQSARRNDLRSHLTAHRNQEIAGKIRCSFCDFLTEDRKSLQKHVRLHQKPKRAKFYKCIKCGYQTALKGDLNIHHVVHECNKTTEFRCDQCELQTMHKSTLQYHLARHRDRKEVKMLKCSHCDYETCRPYYLKRHVVIHENPKTVEKFKCNQCNFQTIRKNYLPVHALTHVTIPNRAEVMLICNNDTPYLGRPEVLYRCKKCGYESFCKKDFKEHLTKHAKRKKMLAELECKKDDFQTVYNKFLKVQSEYS